MAERNGRKKMSDKENTRSKKLINNFLAGIAVFIPLAITIVVLKIGLNIAQQIFGFLPFLNPEVVIGGKVGTALKPFFGVIITFAVIIIIGAIARNYAGKKFVNLAENMIIKIPLLRTVYQASKQLIETLMSTGKTSFRRVVLVQFPREGIYSIGFVTGNAKEALQKPIKEKSYYVFIPTTPNPTNGFFLVVPEKDIIPIDMSIEDAFKAFISAGMATGEDNKQKIEL